MIDHNSANKLDHKIFNKGAFADSNSPKRTSAPSGGGGGFGSGSSGSSGGSNSNGNNSSSNNTQSESDEESTSSEQAPVQEEEEEPVQEQLVKLSNVTFTNPDTCEIDGEVEVSVDIEYITGEQPQKYEFTPIATYQGKELMGTIVTQSANGEKATASVTLPQHQDHYAQQDKGADDKVSYTVRVACIKDKTEEVSEEVLLPSQNLSIDLVEVIDALFELNSAVPSLTKEADLIASLSTCFTHHNEWPDKSVLVYGHTDISGEADSNFTLSKYRAEAIKAILENNPDLFYTAIKNHATVESYQQMLFGFSQLKGWPTHPGEVDGVDGPNTQSALTEFQTLYNEKYEGTLDVDGKIGPKSWGAFCSAIHHLGFEMSGLTDYNRINFKFLDEFKGVYPCGESFPTKDVQSGKINYTSASDRRVEIQFSERPNPPQLPEPAPALTIEEVIVFDEKKCALKQVVVKKGELEVEVAEIDFFMAFSPSAPPEEAYFLIPQEDIEEACQDALSFNNILDDLLRERESLTKISDPTEGAKKSKAFESKWSDKISAQGKPNFDEIILLNSPRSKLTKDDLKKFKGFIRMPKDKIKNAWTKMDINKIKEKVTQKINNHRREKATAPKKSFNDYVTPSVKTSFYKKGTEELYDDSWVFKTKADDWKDNENVDIQASLVLLRAAASIEAGAELNLKEMKLTAGLKATASANLVEGSVTFDYYLPNKEGFDIIAAIQSALGPDKHSHIKKGYHCFICLKLTGKASGFVGANVAVSLPYLNINGEVTKTTGETEKVHCLEAKAEAFAGASGTLEASVSSAWKKTQKEKYSDIAKGGGTVTGAAGIGGEIGLDIEYKDGKIVCSVGAKLVIGLGAGLGVVVELDPKSGFEMIAQIVRAYNYHDIGALLGDVFTIYYKTYLALLTTHNPYLLAGEALKDTVTGWVDSWFGKDDDLKKKEQLQLTDEYIQLAPPEALGPVLAAIIKSHHDDDYKNILRILEQSKEGLADGAPNHELKWLIRYANITTDNNIENQILQIKGNKSDYLEKGKQLLLDFFNHYDSDAQPKQILQLEEILNAV